jgi:hypothetical protein
MYTQLERGQRPTGAARPVALSTSVYSRSFKLGPNSSGVGRNASFIIFLCNNKMKLKSKPKTSASIHGVAEPRLGGPRYFLSAS